MSRYDDIINLPHHVSSVHPQMSMKNRAAQFAPFAALTGHEEAINETARLTSVRPELSAYEQEVLSRRIRAAVGRKMAVRITFYLPDRLKEGGSINQTEAIIKRIDETERRLVLENGIILPLDYILGVG